MFFSHYTQNRYELILLEYNGAYVYQDIKAQKNKGQIPLAFHKKIMDF